MKWNKTKLFCLCLGLSSYFASQHLCAIPLPPNHFRTLSIGSFVEVLRDDTKKLTLREVQSARYAKEFRKQNREVPSFGLTESAHWLKFTLENRGAARNLYLELPYPLLDDVQLYVQGKQGLQKFHTGDRLPFSHRPILVKNFLFPILFSPQESKTFYLRVQSQGSVQVPLRLWSSTAHIEYQHQEQ